jgi:polyisoprenyl-teichoic acid--peptidoglycan teichoic acid transferase
VGKSLQANPKQARSKGWFALAVSVVAICSVVGGGLAFVSRWQPFLSPEQQQINAQFEKAHLDNALNILLLGTDIVASTKGNARNWHPPTNSFNGRSDTMLLIHFDPSASQVNVISIPRDTRTMIPGHGAHKINVANVYGGPVLAAQTVTNLVGAPINRYVRINPQGVIELIDALGGVTVYIPKAMHYRDDSQHLYIDLPQGLHTLSGLQAQQYLRFRADELGDIGRVQRQQALLRALADRAVKPETLVKIGDILNVVKKNIDTNLSVEDIFALAKFAKGIDIKKDLRMVMLPGRFSRPHEYEVSYWIPQTEVAASLGARFFGAPTPENALPALTLATMHLSIQNATGQPGMARQLGASLRKQGFKHIAFTNDRPDPIWATEIVAQKGNIDAAQVVSDLLKVGTVKVDATGSLQSDVTVRLGKDWLKQIQASSTP